MLLAKRTQVYTIPEFFNSEEVERFNSLDKAIGHIRKNKNIYLKLVCCIAFILFVFNIKVVFAGGKVVEVMATGEALSFSEIMNLAENFGRYLIKFAVKSGRVIVILLMIYAIVKDAFEGANHRIGNKFLFFIVLLVLISIAPFLEGFIDSILKSIIQQGGF